MIGKLPSDIKFVWVLARDMHPEWTHNQTMDWVRAIGSYTEDEVNAVKPWRGLKPSKVTIQSKYQMQTKILEEPI